MQTSRSGNGRVEPFQCILQLFDISFFVTAADGETASHLITVQTVTADVTTTKKLLDHVEVLIQSDDLKEGRSKIDRVEQCMQSLAQDLNRARSNPYTHIVYGSQQQRSITIGVNNIGTFNRLKNLSVAHSSLKSSITFYHSLLSFNKQSATNLDPVTSAHHHVNTKSSDFQWSHPDPSVMSDRQQLLHYRRLARMRPTSKSDLQPLSHHQEQTTAQYPTLEKSSDEAYKPYSAARPPLPSCFPDYNRAWSQAAHPAVYELEGNQSSFEVSKKEEVSNLEPNVRSSVCSSEVESNVNRSQLLHHQQDIATRNEKQRNSVSSAYLAWSPTSSSQIKSIDSTSSSNGTGSPLSSVSSPNLSLNSDVKARSQDLLLSDNKCLFHGLVVDKTLGGTKYEALPAATSILSKSLYNRSSGDGYNSKREPLSTVIPLNKLRNSTLSGASASVGSNLSLTPDQNDPIVLAKHCCTQPNSQPVYPSHLEVGTNAVSDLDRSQVQNVGLSSLLTVPRKPLSGSSSSQSIRCLPKVVPVVTVSAPCQQMTTSHTSPSIDFTSSCQENRSVDTLKPIEQRSTSSVDALKHSPAYELHGNASNLGSIVPQPIHRRFRSASSLDLTNSTLSDSFGDANSETAESADVVHHPIYSGPDFASAVDRITKHEERVCSELQDSNRIPEAGFPTNSTGSVSLPLRSARKRNTWLLRQVEKSQQLPVTTNIGMARAGNIERAQNQALTS